MEGGRVFLGERRKGRISCLPTEKRKKRRVLLFLYPFRRERGKEERGLSSRKEGKALSFSLYWKGKGGRLKHPGMGEGVEGGGGGLPLCLAAKGKKGKRSGVGLSPREDRGKGEEWPDGGHILN